MRTRADGNHILVKYRLALYIGLAIVAGCAVGIDFLPKFALLFVGITFGSALVAVILYIGKALTEDIDIDDSHQNLDGGDFRNDEFSQRSKATLISEAEKRLLLGDGIKNIAFDLSNYREGHAVAHANFSNFVRNSAAEASIFDRQPIFFRHHIDMDSSEMEFGLGVHGSGSVIAAADRIRSAKSGRTRFSILLIMNRSRIKYPKTELGGGGLSSWGANA